MICQFCGKQVGDNEKICRYCGSNLEMPASGAAEPKGSAYNSDETIVMPSRTKPVRKSAPPGFENSRAVQRSANADVKRPSEHRTEQKRQYYRYNPNAETNRRAERRPSSADRKRAPRYSKASKGNHSVLKWAGKIILLAIVGIAAGILIYLGVNGITNAVKSIGNHENAPASVSTPAPKKTDKSSSSESESSVKNENTKKNVENEDTLNEENSRTEEKSSITSENKNNSSQNSKNEDSRPAADESNNSESEGSSNSERTDSETNESSGSGSNSNSSTNKSESGSEDDALEN